MKIKPILLLTLLLFGVSLAREAQAFYNPSTGRWLSRDPAGETNPYLFVRNRPVSAYDVLGLWGSSVHRDWTTRWSQQLGISLQTAELIGLSDDSIDSLHDPKVINNDNWSWHFNRSRIGDSRFSHRDDELNAARAQCRIGVDNPIEAARHLGYALHPDQDWVAHADYNRIQETPNASLFASDVEYYIHNFGSSGDGSTSWPDDETLDADDSTDHGRATLGAMNGQHGGHRLMNNNDIVYWDTYHFGGQRLRLTRDKTKGWLKDFQDFVKTQGQACNCRSAFLAR